MKLTADYHTHTRYSHGSGTVFDNAAAADKLGLKELAITDHGFNHPAFGLKERKMPHLLQDVAAANEKYAVKVTGVESNILSESGKTDLPPSKYDEFDVFLTGFHKFVLCGVKDIFNLFLPNYLRHGLRIKPSKDLVRRTTKTYINVIKNNPIDAVTHMNFCVFADALEVAKCAADYGTYIELNTKKTRIDNIDGRLPDFRFRRFKEQGEK